MMRPFITLILVLLLSSQSYGQQIVIDDSAQIDDTEIPFLLYPSKSPGKTIIWFEPHYGEFTSQPVAAALAQQGITVYQPNWFETFFLPRSYSSPAMMDGKLIAAFIQYVKQKETGPVYLLGASRGTVAALNGIATDNSNINGLIALNPSIYLRKPEPMQPIEFVPAASKCPVSIMILQPKQSTRIWWMDEVESILRSGGATVRSQFISDVRDGFWQRPDLTDDEISRKKRFHLDIMAAIDTLETLDEK